jgi:acyl-CoA oxidase
MEHSQKTERDDLKAVLKKLCDLFVLYNLEQNLAVLVEDGFVNGTQAKLLKKTVMSLCHQVRNKHADKSSACSSLLIAIWFR